VVAITWPTNTAPGKNAQDGSGRLINVFPEQRQNGQGLVYRRVPGLTWFTSTYASTAAMTGTGTVTLVGAWTGPSGGVGAFTGSGAATFVGST
jgi:hypothetical protein